MYYIYKISNRNVCAAMTVTFLVPFFTTQKHSYNMATTKLYFILRLGAIHIAIYIPTRIIGIVRDLTVYVYSYIGVNGAIYTFTRTNESEIGLIFRSQGAFIIWFILKFILYKTWNVAAHDMLACARATLVYIIKCYDSVKKV